MLGELIAKIGGIGFHSTSLGFLFAAGTATRVSCCAHILNCLSPPPRSEYPTLYLAAAVLLEGAQLGIRVRASSWKDASLCQALAYFAL